jgi:hypothetical protein
MRGRLWVPVASGPLARYAAGYGSWLVVGGPRLFAVDDRPQAVAARSVEPLAGA